MVNILIPEKIPAHNKGEEAILRGIIKTLDFIPNKNIYLYSKSPAYDQEKYKDCVHIISESLIPDPECTAIKKLLHVTKYLSMHIIYALCWNISKNFAKKVFNGGLWKVYNEMDFVIAAHDSAYTIMHNILILFCKSINKPIIIYGTSVLPFLYRKKWVKNLTKYCIAKADLITVREPVTRNVLVDKVGVSAEKVRLTADKAFLLQPISNYDSIELLKNNNVIVGNRKIIGMTILHKTGFFNTLEYSLDKHISDMVKFVEFVIAETRAIVIFFPHSIGPTVVDDDRIAARQVFEMSSCRESIRLIEGDFSVAQLKGMIGCCDFFVGERTHSVIGAVSMYVPSIVITHAEDFRTVGILGDMVGMKSRVFDISVLNNIQLQNLFLESWRNRETIRRELSVKIPEIVKCSLLNGELLQKTLEGKVNFGRR